MSSFEDLALQYVVGDDEVVMRDLAAKAAKAIEDAGASRIAVGNWAASIKLWIAPGSNYTGATDGTEDGESGNAITRAKAIGFLTATLEVMDKDLLRADQVELLIGFFGSMFSNDHKAGITPAVAALKQLATAKNFRPTMGVKIVEDVSKMKEDFRLQTAATRLEAYQLLLRLVQDQDVAGELQHKYGAPSGFVMDLLAMCQAERDPKNLMVWFKIIKTLVGEYSPSADVTEEVFKAFSNYFPITLRESTTPIGVTPEELKSSLRECFSAHGRLAPLTFPYLIQRLDQGDSMKVTVKLDILMTIKACIDNYGAAFYPYITTVWNSLKYEVRNGEVQETVDGAILVLRAIATNLQGDSARLNEYISTVFGDSLDDLADEKYVKPAGGISLAVISSSPQAFVSHSPKLVDSVVQKIPQFKTSTNAPYTQDLLDLLHAILQARQSLVELYPTHDKLASPKSATHFQNLFHRVYLPVWQKNVAFEGGPELGVLRAITSGVAMLVSQQIVLPDGKRSLLCSGEVCSEICSLFTHRLLMPLRLSPKDAATMAADVDIGLQESLSTIVTYHMDGFGMLVANTTAAILSRDWKVLQQKRPLEHLWQMLSRVSFIGCSQLRIDVDINTSGDKKYSPLQHFLTWTGALLQLIESFLTNATDTRVVKQMVAAMHHAMCCFRGACGSQAKEVNLLPNGKDSVDWATEFKKATDGAEISREWLNLLGSHYPDIYSQYADSHGQVSLEPRDDAYPAASSSQDIFANFTRLSLFIIRHLFRRVTKQGLGSDRQPVLRLADEIKDFTQYRRTAVLEQIEKMATMTVQGLDAPSQRFYNLPTEAFQLFSDCQAKAPYWSVEDDGALNLLTLSILSGLWPDAMTDLYKPNGIAQTVLCNHEYAMSVNVSRSQAWIVVVLSNKYKPSPSAIDFAQIVEFWRSRIEQNMPSYGPDADVELETDIEQLLSILVGTVPRQEKAILPLIPLTHKAIGLPNQVGAALAANIDEIVMDNEYLQTGKHAVIKPLFKQWIYAHFVKPLYDRAVPADQGSDLDAISAEHFTRAIMSMLKHCSYAVYESDIESLVSICLSVLQSKKYTIADVQSALQILNQILSNDAMALKYHLRAIIKTLKNVYRVAAAAKRDPPARSRPEWEPSYGQPRAKVEHPLAKHAAARKVLLQILGGLPGRFDARYVMPFKGDMNHFLDACCGDPVRELRKAAVEAKEEWFAVS